jgi:hypothetical protein
MSTSHSWKVVRRIRSLVDGRTKTDYDPVAGPFSSMTDAQRWIDTHPDEGPNLAAKVIWLRPEKTKRA